MKRAQRSRRIILAFVLCAIAACDRSVRRGDDTDPNGTPHGSGGGGQIDGRGGGGAGAVPGTGGAGGTGGTGGTGSIGGAGNSSGGADGGVATCQVNATQCSANGLQTCGANGQWGVAVPCGPSQVCGGAVGSAACVCASSCTLGATQCTSSTSLESCAPGPDGCNVRSTTACDNGLVCGRLTPASCADPNWAQWAVPPSTSPTDYTDNGDGTVTDKITGLMWEKTRANATMTQAAAVTHCAMATTGGYSDWRLPSKIELVSIVDFRGRGTVNPIFNVSASHLWSSTLCAGATSQAWTVNLGGSLPNPYRYGMTSALSVLCVR